MGCIVCVVNLRSIWFLGCLDLLWICARENSGEHRFSRPSEHVSPRWDYWELAWVFLREVSPGRHIPFIWASHVLAQARRTRLSERAQKAIVPLFEPSPRRRWALLSESPSPERESLAWARPFSLSEVLGEAVHCVIVFLTWMVIFLLGFKYCDESMR